MESCDPVGTLMEIKDQLDLYQNGIPVDVTKYRSMIGALMYLTSSRPDIAHATCFCAQYQAKPTKKHIKEDSGFELTGFSDADYVGCKDTFKSTSCGAQFLGEKLMDYQLADLFTKALPVDRFINLVRCLDQTVSGKDSSNPLMAENLPTIVWYSTHHVTLNEELASPKAKALGVNTPRRDEDRLELMELTVFLLPKVNDVTRLQALVDKKKVVVTRARIREALHLDNAEGVDCLPNEEIFADSLMTSAVICLSSGRKFNFSKYIFDSLVDEEGDANKNVKEVNVDDAAEGDVSVAHGEVPTIAEEPSIPSPTPPTPPPQPTHDIPSTSQEGEEAGEEECGEKVEVQKDDKEEDREVADAVKDVEEAKDDTKLAEVQEVVDVVTTTKIITEVVTAASETVTAASANITTVEVQVPAATLTAAPARVASAPSRRRKGVVISDPESESTTSIIIPAKTKSKDKGKGILVKEPKPLKKKQQIEQDEQYARELHAKINKDIDWDEVIDHVKLKAKEDPTVKKYQAVKRKPQTKAQARKNIMLYLKNVVDFKMDYFKGMSYDDTRLIFKANFNLNVAFLLKTKEQIEEDENRALQKLNETLIERVAKRRKLDEEVEELKRHLQIVPNEDDDALWNLVKERFSTTKPKKFSDDFLLVTLKEMFKKPDVHAQIWKNQRTVHGPTKVKGWKLLESCGVQIITFTSTRLILLVKRKYPLIRFTLDQMLNVVSLEVKEESEVSLELLRFI
nr:hypothetical protein [Tanacetum cinerariifolium]